MPKPLLLAALALAAPFAHAFGFADIQNWTGSGPNRAALVIDFKDGGPAYAWGYRYSGTKTGYDLLTDVANTDPLLDYTYTQYSFGKAVTGIRYGSLASAGFDPNTPGYWGYYVADNTAAAPASWTEAQVGYEARALATDSWDGWSWAANFTAAPPTNNIVAAAPVPEPASIAALGLGALALLRRRRSR